MIGHTKYWHSIVIPIRCICTTNSIWAIIARGAWKVLLFSGIIYWKVLAILLTTYVFLKLNLIIIVMVIPHLKDWQMLIHWLEVCIPSFTVLLCLVSGTITKLSCIFMNDHGNYGKIQMNGMKTILHFRSPKNLKIQIDIFQITRNGEKIRWKWFLVCYPPKKMGLKNLFVKNMKI